MLFRVQVSFAPGFDYGDEIELDPDEPEVQASLARGELRPVRVVLPDGGWRPGAPIPAGTDLTDAVRQVVGGMSPFVPDQPETL